MMEPISRAPRYMTLRDYLRVIRRYRIAIALIAIVGAAAGYVTAKQQTPVYQAKTSVAFQDPTQALGIVGFGTASATSPAQIAAEASETMTRPSVMTKVQHNLGTSRSVGSLASSISGQVSFASGLLDITAKSSDPAFAARLANEVAQVVVNQDNVQTQNRFASVTRDLRGKIASLSRGRNPAGSGGQLSFDEDELGRLETLRRFASSAQIAQVAQPPGSPASPNTLRSTLIGLALGLLLAIMFAFFRDSMDRRIRTADDAEASFRLPILGHLRAGALGRLTYTAHGRGEAYTARGDSEEHSADLEAFRILRRNLEFLNLDAPPRVVVVTSAVAEEGKTTVAGSLAFTIASTGKRTLLVDCDLRRPALAGKLGIEQSPGISDFLAGEATPQQLLRTISFSEAPGANGAGPAGPAGRRSLVFIPSGPPTTSAAELLGSNRFKEFLEQVSQAYEAVVIDSSPLLPVADTLEMLPSVDGIVVCARTRRTTRAEAAAVSTALSRFPERPLGLVLTGIRKQDDEGAAYVYSYQYS